LQGYQLLTFPPYRSLYGNEEQDMLVNQSSTQVDVGLFFTRQQAQEPAEMILDVISPGRNAERASSFQKSASAEPEGYYPDPRLRGVDDAQHSDVMNRVLDAMKALRDGALREIEAGWRNAVAQKTGTTLEAAERLSAEEWQALPGDLRRSGSEASLLKVRLAVANGDFTHAGSIGFPGGEAFADAQAHAESVTESMATFRTLQIKAIVSQVHDGSIAGLAERVGATSNLSLPHVAALSDVDLNTMRAGFIA
jgi:hypothetical protein